MEKDKIFYTLVVLGFSNIGLGLLFLGNRKVMVAVKIIAAIIIFSMAMILIWW